MNCKYKINIHKWIDGELERSRQREFESHAKLCAICQGEVKSLQKLNGLIRTSAPSIEPSLNFEGRFWQKVLSRKKESLFTRVLRNLENLIPIPNFAQAVAALVIAFLVGSTGGAVSVFSSGSGQNEPAIYLSGSPEYQGLPNASIAASYLKTIEGRTK
jgi:anti-sigma factor RsiW